MLSICIPFYNYPNYKLANDLWHQIENVNEKVELLVIDDASDLNLRPQASKFEKGVKFIQLQKNLGRAKVRNHFLKNCMSEHLLFIDGDSQLITTSFLKDYLKVLQKSKAEVICGRSVYPEKKPPKQRRLRWLYGKRIEAQDVESRSESPYQAFMTNNFIIKQSLLVELPFEERIVNYGHEDTLMGFRLQQAKCTIEHINNPVLNATTEENSLYLKKTKEAVRNLIDIQLWVEDKDAFVEHVKLARFYRKINQLGLAGFFGFIYSFFGKQMESYFTKGGNSLKLFTLWKLTYYSVEFNRRP
ncbi:MAG: glycosyltransferase family 2 protein [Vicingaceae bacterium]